MRIPKPVKALYVLSITTLLSVWLMQDSINAYWTQTYHRPAPISGLSQYSWWASGARWYATAKQSLLKEETALADSVVTDTDDETNTEIGDTVIHHETGVLPPTETEKPTLQVAQETPTTDTSEMTDETTPVTIEPNTVQAQPTETTEITKTATVTETTVTEEEHTYHPSQAIERLLSRGEAEQLLYREGKTLNEVITEPEIVEPEVAEPEVVESEVVESEVVESEVVESEVVESEVAESEVAESEVAESEVAESEIVESEVVESEVVESEVVESEVVESEVVESEVVESEVVKSEVAESDVTQIQNIPPVTIQLESIHIDTIPSESNKADIVKVETTATQTPKTGTIDTKIIDTKTIETEAIETGTAKKEAAKIEVAKAEPIQLKTNQETVNQQTVNQETVNQETVNQITTSKIDGHNIKAQQNQTQKKKASNTLQLKPSQRVFFVGDSLMQGVAPHVKHTLRKQYGIKSINLSKQSTGLSYSSFFNWPKTVEQTLKKHPDIGLIVVFLGPNDPWDVPNPKKKGGKYIRFRSPEWEQLYRDKIQRIIASAKKRQVQVLWLGVPNMRKKKLNTAMHYLNTLYHSEAEKSGIMYIPTRQLLGSNSDAYSKYAKNDKGKKVAVRTNDGIHFTPTGQRRIARKIASLIEVNQ